VAVPITETRNKRELKRNFFHLETATDFCLRSYCEHQKLRRPLSAGCVSDTYDAVYYILRLWYENSDCKHF
jgi:hypothetical protein